ncbi:putative hydroxymethyltransferase, partial [Nemania sp. FL0916]
LAYNEKIVEVTAKLEIAGPYLFNSTGPNKDTITWGINGDLTGDSSACINSFEPYAGELPSGTVAITVPEVPDPALLGSEQTITLTQGGFSEPPYSVIPGEITTVLVPEGRYTVKADELANADETVVTAASVSPTDIPSYLRRLPASGTVTITSGLAVNNTKYTSSQSGSLSNALIRDLADESITIRLISTDSAVVYTDQVVAVSGTTEIKVLVSPGTYTASALGFVKDGTMWAAQVANEIVVAADGSSKLGLTIKQGPHLKVRGFPDYLSFGALSDLVDLEGRDLTAARVTSVFKYAGCDGAGDAEDYLIEDMATAKTVTLAGLISEKLGGQSVLPVIISYTVNLSGGESNALQRPEGLAHSFGNLILSLKTARKTSEKKISAGFVVNPDFLGENQKSNRGPKYKMPVRGPLCDALDHHGVTEKMPDAITDTLGGYVQAVNWLIRTVAPEVTFGWQINLCGVGSSTWIYKGKQTSPEEYAQAPIVSAQATANYVKSLGVYSGHYVPDFLAIDRYEADDFTTRAIVNSYCYGPTEWRRFFEFSQAVALELKTPGMPWQIPASRIPNADEAVTRGSLERDQLGPLVGQETVGALFRSEEPFDLGNAAYGFFPLRGIFTVLLGGGSATGVVSTIGSTGPWTQQRISEYMEEPILFDNGASRK